MSTPRRRRFEESVNLVLAHAFIALLFLVVGWVTGIFMSDGMQGREIASGILTRAGHVYRVTPMEVGQ